MMQRHRFRVPTASERVGALSGLYAEIETVAADPALPDLPFSLFRRFRDGGHRLEFERRYFARRARLAALAARAMLRPDLATDDLADVMWSVCDEYTWALPAHLPDDPGTLDAATCVDLFAAETAHTLAETVAGLGSRVDSRVAARVCAEVRRRVFTRFDDPAPFGWEGSRHNWEAVCAGAVGLAAFALIDDDARLRRLLARCRRAMDSFLDGYGDDGGCAEGVAYWAYGFGYFTYFAEALRQATGEDLMSSAKVAQISGFPERVWLGGAAYVPFSDTQRETPLPAGLLTRLAERFGTSAPAMVPSFHDDHCYRWGHLSRTLAWYQPAQTPSPEPKVDVLADLGWVVARGRYTFAAKGGHNDEPHNHLDLGHFIVHVDGVSVLDDLGAGEYTRDYFCAGRYDALQPSALGHSVPLIDGQPQLAGADRRARILRCEPTSSGVQFDVDLTAAYEVAGLRSFIRRFDWRHDGRLDLRDELVIDRPMRFEELLISRCEPEVAGAMVRWAGAVTLDFTGMTAQAQTLHTTDHFGQPDTVRRVHLQAIAPAGRSVWHLRFSVRSGR